MFGMKNALCKFQLLLLLIINPHYSVLAFLLPLPFRKRNTIYYVFEIVSC